MRSVPINTFVIYRSQFIEKMIRTVTQEVGLEERLKPDVGETHSPQSMHQCGQQNFGKSMHSKLACGLLRSPSLERLRQFPSYLCTRGSYDFKVWLENSRTALSDSISRSLLVAHELIFTLFVYSIILTIVAQVCLVMNTLVFYKVPRGPTFLYVTTAILGGIMFIAVPFTSTKPRPHPNSLAGQEVTAQPTPEVSEKTE
ncbi:hypothetical protein M8J77_023604 [Diaphorina citri]|nr:hypothetical protein M8J77_023604 [Diaphorina citri]